MQTSSILGVAALLVATGAAQAADDTIKVGFMTTLEGTYTVPGQDGQRGYQMAFKEHNGITGGKKIDTVVAS